MTVFSFHPVKHITTGEGGVVLTRDPELAERLRAFRHHGLSDDGTGAPGSIQMRQLGVNGRITDFQCALGQSQLRKLDAFLARREAIARRYTQALAPLGFRGQPVRPGRHAWHLYAVELPPEVPSAERDAVYRAFQNRGIQVNIHYRPVPLQPYYREQFGFSPGDYPVAERHWRRTLTLPLFPALRDEQVETVIAAAREILQGVREPAHPAVSPAGPPSRGGA